MGTSGSGSISASVGRGFFSSTAASTATGGGGGGGGGSTPSSVCGTTRGSFSCVPTTGTAGCLAADAAAAARDPSLSCDSPVRSFVRDGCARCTGGVRDRDRERDEVEEEEDDEEEDDRAVRRRVDDDWPPAG